MDNEMYILCIYIFIFYFQIYENAVRTKFKKKKRHNAVKETISIYLFYFKRRWPSGKVLAYRAQGRGFNPWPSHGRAIP